MKISATLANLWIPTFTAYASSAITNAAITSTTSTFGSTTAIAVGSYVVIDKGGTYEFKQLINRTGAGPYTYTVNSSFTASHLISSTIDVLTNFYLALHIADPLVAGGATEVKNGATYYRQPINYTTLGAPANSCWNPFDVIMLVPNQPASYMVLWNADAGAGNALWSVPLFGTLTNGVTATSAIAAGNTTFISATLFNDNATVAIDIGANVETKRIMSHTGAGPYTYTVDAAFTLVGGHAIGTAVQQCSTPYTDNSLTSRGVKFPAQSNIFSFD